ncbi:MAG: threonine synthase [Puniceicoccales bacterium]|jgi:threonine synthase|nr:threonine synthase [Puniceicoccales bacterium]
MNFVSTRGRDSASFNEAVIRGLAADGGLFVPERLPDLSPHLKRWRGKPYVELAADFLSFFATDVSAGALYSCLSRAYAAFPVPPAPLVQLGDGLHVLELFHGPTLAFKDFALQLLGQFYGLHIHTTGRPLNILGATSGDTGSAAIHGMLEQPGAHSFILYPEGRIAELQERQIACTGSPRVHPLAVRGSFDDAQAIVKQIFGDVAFSAAHSLTAVNSINIARILAQCIYYLDAALKLNPLESDPVEFIVPTGNFGNVLAGWMLGKMGVPGLRFCVASNANAVVAEFFRSGVYRPGTVTPSLAPSMDIQQASNFERWLWWHFNGDSVRVCEALEAIRNRGVFSADTVVSPDIRATTCDDAGIRAQIARVYREHSYVADPHTACAFAAVRPGVRSVVLATAHPAKFPDTIQEATSINPVHPSLEALKGRPVVKQVLPAEVGAVRAAIEAVQK